MALRQIVSHRTVANRRALMPAAPGEAEGEAHEMGVRHRRAT
jgi:hypothetical protein